MSSCSACPRGAFALAAASACSRCERGRFALGERSSSCTECGQGTSAPDPGMSACVACRPGTFASETGSYLLFHPALLMHRKSSGQAACTPAPPGQWAAAGAVRLTPCAAGRFGSTAGQVTANCTGVCKCVESEPPNSSHALAVSVGYFCPANATSATQFACPAGRFGSTTGLSTSSCSGVCQAGYYCVAASTSAAAAQCPTGSDSAPGGSSLSSCLCAPGFGGAGASACVGKLAARHELRSLLFQLVLWASSRRRSPTEHARAVRKERTLLCNSSRLARSAAQVALAVAWDRARLRAAELAKSTSSARLAR